MEPDHQRLDRVRGQMRDSGLDALICRLPHNVLMLTGYAPILGNSFALFPLDGDPALVVPESEETMARQGWVLDVRPYRDGSLSRLDTVSQAVRPLLDDLFQEKGLLGAVIGFEHEYGMVPASYNQFATTSSGTYQLLREAAGNAEWRAADGDLELLEAVLTEREVDLVRLANLVAADGLQAGRQAVRPGVRESDVAAEVGREILAAGHRLGPAQRVLPFPHVLSGPRSEDGYRPFGVTSGREILRGDTVLVQLEVYLDGFWAEVTRTFMVGLPKQEHRKAYEACLEAMARARQAERAGVAASEVDYAARTTLDERGYGGAFRHGLGHGVGFQAISHERRPRLHPASPDILQQGMVHNMEPAVYMDGFGLRINDDVLVTGNGVEVLTPLKTDLDWAVCGGRKGLRAA